MVKPIRPNPAEKSWMKNCEIDSKVGKIYHPKGTSRFKKLVNHFRGKMGVTLNLMK